MNICNEIFINFFMLYISSRNFFLRNSITLFEEISNLKESFMTLILKSRLSNV